MRTDGSRQVIFNFNISFELLDVISHYNSLVLWRAACRRRCLAVAFKLFFGVFKNAVKEALIDNASRPGA